MVGVGVWALVRWLTYSLMAMATVWRGRDVEEAPSRRSGGQVGPGRVKPGVESSRVPSEYRVGVVRSGPVRPAHSELRSYRSSRPITTDGMEEPANRPMQRGGSVWVVGRDSR